MKTALAKDKENKWRGKGKHCSIFLFGNAAAEIIHVTDASKLTNIKNVFQSKRARNEETKTARKDERPLLLNAKFVSFEISSRICNSAVACGGK